MPMDPRDNISTSQAAVAVALITIGVSILTLPRTITEVVGTSDGWLSILLAGGLTLITGYIAVSLARNFPSKTYYQYNIIIAGRVLGYIASILLIIYFILLAGYEARALSELVRIYLLESTPTEVVVILFLGVGIYLVVGGMNPIMQMMEVHFPVIMFLILLGIVLGFRKFELDNLLPVLSQGMLPVLKGIMPTFISYIGFEIMLIITAFMEKPAKAFKAVSIGICISTMLYLIIFIVTIGMLTANEVKTLTWPVATASMEMEMPGGIIERFEPVFLVIWILTIYTTFVLSYYFAGLGISQLFKSNIQYFLYGLLPVIYIVAMLPPDIDYVLKMGDMIGYLGIFAGAFIPFLLLILVVIRGLNNEKK